MIAAPAEIERPIEAPSALTPPARSGGFWMVVVGLPVLCVTAVTLALILRADPPATPFVAPPAAAMPEVASAPEPVEAPEVMPVAFVPPAAPATAAPAVAAPVARPTRRRPPVVRPVAPATQGLRFDGNLLESDDTLRRR